MNSFTVSLIILNKIILFAQKKENFYHFVPERPNHFDIFIFNSSCFYRDAVISHLYFIFQFYN